MVENLVGYIRRNVCVPLPRVKDLDELNAKLLEQCLKYQGHKAEIRPEKVGKMLKEDRKSLQRMQSLWSYLSSHTLSPFGIRVSLENYGSYDDIRVCPVYSAHKIRDISI